VAPGVRRGRRASPQPLHPLPHVVAVPTHDRQVEHGDGDLGGVATDLLAVPAQHGRLLLHGVHRHVARVAQPGRDPQRAPLATAADDHRHVVQRARVRRRLRQGGV
jgi:hypothetical protein